MLSLYFPGKNQATQQVYAPIKCELHLINGFPVNILVRNNILSPERFVININKNHAFIGICRVTIPINARQRGQFLKRKLLASNKNVIPPCSKTMISLSPVSLSDKLNFLFYPTTQANLTLYIHIVDHTLTKILVSNTSNCSLRISQY